MLPGVLPLVTATRYVAPLREGGSLPGLVEADDLGTYVAKFTGAGQGRKALIAEIIAGELARRLGLRVPDMVIIDLDPVIGRHEPDEEVQDLLNASPGWNLGIDFLPGALGYDLLVWNGDVWLIDHGASLYFHHTWAGAGGLVGRPYDAGDHVLAPYAKQLPDADGELAPRVTEELLHEVVALVPEPWLAGEPGF